MKYTKKQILEIIGEDETNLVHARHGKNCSYFECKAVRIKNKLRARQRKMLDELVS